MTRYTVHFSGRVQGVGFRQTAAGIAARHPVVGYVQNLRDGRVRLVCEGAPAALDEFIRELQRTMGRYIEQTHQDESAATGEFGRPGVDALTIRY